MKDLGHAQVRALPTVASREQESHTAPGPGRLTNAVGDGGGAAGTAKGVGPGPDPPSPETPPTQASGQGPCSRGSHPDGLAPGWKRS